MMKSFVKMRGETGPVHLERVHNDAGEPVGYGRIAGVNLLDNPDQEAAFGRLPQQFTFKEAKSAYGKTDNPTTQWLKKCESTGLIRKTARGFYERV